MAGSAKDRREFDNAAVSWFLSLAPAVAPTGFRGPLPRGRSLWDPTYVLTLGVALLLLFCVSVAHAEVPKLVSYGNFTAEGPGIAVDQPSGNVFTGGLFTYCDENQEQTICAFGGSLKRFDLEGRLIAPFGPTSFYTGAAVNPVNKDLYVLNGFGSIETYDPSTGEELSSFPVTESHNFLFLTIVQIAADASGDVYVPVSPENEVLEYSETGTLLNTFKGSGAGALKEPTGVAVDPAGDLWVADTGNNRIEELSPAGAPLGEIASEGVSSVALGPGGGVFAVVYNDTDFCASLSPPCVHLAEYSSTGAQLADVGAGDIGDASGPRLGAANSMVAVNESTGRVYVSDAARDHVWMFGPPKAPEVAKELTVDVTGTEAELGALVNAGGLTTSYRFEYGTTGAYGNVVPSGERDTVGVKAKAVWASVESLAPGTTYHYRVVVQNALGSVEGPDETFTTPAAEAACPNEALRMSFSASLPDCRAYEMVTQPNSASAQPDPRKINFQGANWGDFTPGGGFTKNHAARDGDRFSYQTVEVMPGAESAGMEYVAARGHDGWSSETVLPLQSYDNMFCNNPDWGNAIQAYSSQLTAGVVRVGANQREGGTSEKGVVPGGCGTEGLEVVQGEPAGVENLLLRDAATGDYRLIDMPPAGATPTDAHFEGASADLSHVFFKETARLTENGPPGVEGLYEWDEGALRLVSELPDGRAAAGSLAAHWAARPSVVSADGSHVFFTAEGDLYLRVDGERTVQLDEPQGGPGPGGGGQFLNASADGTQAYFADDASAGLTADTVPGSGANLYRYANGRLTDLTPAEHVEFLKVLGVSAADGVYFEANGVLSGSQANQNGEVAKPGEANIYEWKGGQTTFIATVADYGFFEGATAVSPNGAFLAFVSAGSLTGYDNIDQSTGQPATEIYLYSSASQGLVCVSCNSSGEAPSGTRGEPFPGGAMLADSERGPGQESPHYLSDDGRMVFQTEEALLPGDTNGQMDVYEYEEGQLHLISSGTGGSRSWLLDAGEELRDVFFLSRQPLVPQDTGGEEESNIVYDAREGGGFPAAVSPPACTTADACRAPSVAQPSIYGAPSSQTFAGAGNLAPAVRAHERAKPKRKARCRKGSQRRRGRCVKSRPKGKAKQSHHRGRR
jgi:hypothetical protein